MVAELISVGTEILLGNIVNTNAAYLSRQCAALGVLVYHQVTVGDNEERLLEALRQAMDRSDLIILTGGLGPTRDDMTKETVAKLLHLELVQDEHSLSRIQAYFKQRSFEEIPENNYKQAQIIEGCTVLDNDNGTAPGLIVTVDDKKRIILLPGPSEEMAPMFEKGVCPLLKSLQETVLYSKMVKICGIGESAVETQIMDLIKEQSNPTIATYAKLGEVHIRVTAKASSEEEAKQLVKPIVKELKDRFRENVFTTNENESMEQVIADLLNKYDLTVTTAESCTGGMVASRLVNVVGISNSYKQGFITYSNKAKRKYLNVNKATLKQYSAVSEQVAKEMATGAALMTDSDAAVAITGYAGPDGGTEEEPVGTVYISCYVNGKTVVKRYRFLGNRQKIRELATIHALDLLRRSIINKKMN